ncbi:MAG: peptidylprolyl isomerase [Planctomycetes bacterium]|nr:peptidylprolyl isomerase [Planctomycetota bacterium]
MLARVCFATLILFSAAASVTAQVVRFETSLGSFDMVLNPTNNARLRGHVDNMLDYIENNNYNGSWINRADTGFVLQMGGFFAHTKRPPMTIASTRPVDAFAPIQGEPAVTFTGLSNTVGTVSLALPGGAGGTNQDGGTSSFFVNLTSNTFLDADFTVFAAIPDMTVVNQIMALTKIDRTTDPMFGAGAGNLGFTDVPVQANGFQVFINRAFVITDTMTIARATAGVQSAIAQSAAVFASGGEGGSSALLSSSGAVPEPACITTALIALLGAGLFAMRGRRN